MVILEVYTKCIQNKYKTTLLSKATIFVFITQAFKIIVPYIIAYNSGGLLTVVANIKWKWLICCIMFTGFWLKHATFYEQPNIRFNGQYLLSALTNNMSEPIACTTFPEYYNKITNYDKCSITKVCWDSPYS